MKATVRLTISTGLLAGGNYCLYIANLVLFPPPFLHLLNHCYLDPFSPHPGGSRRRDRTTVWLDHSKISICSVYLSFWTTVHVGSLNITYHSSAQLHRLIRNQNTDSINSSKILMFRYFVKLGDHSSLPNLLHRIDQSSVALIHALHS